MFPPWCSSAVLIFFHLQQSTSWVIILTIIKPFRSAYPLMVILAKLMMQQKWWERLFSRYLASLCWLSRIWEKSTREYFVVFIIVAATTILKLSGLRRWVSDGTLAACRAAISDYQYGSANKFTKFPVHLISVYRFAGTFRFHSLRKKLCSLQQHWQENCRMSEDWRLEVFILDFGDLEAMGSNGLS